jgi:2-methylisocitrate lyase-like PEP mutase family enzyme
MTQKNKAELLRRLHGGPEILVLPNAWDAISARVMESEGFPAVATSSSGCAAVLGYADGQQIPRGEMIFLIAKIVNAVKTPVTADVEAGYDDAEQTALDVIAAGAVGLNLEDMAGDTLLPLENQLQRLRTLRTVADESGVPLVINARTDIYLARHGDPANRFERSVERLNAFRAAGADCLFVPGVRDAETIGRLVQAINGPVNILAMPGSPSIAELQALGVARVSFGGGPSRIAMGAVRRFVRELRDRGTYPALAQEAIPSQETQDLLARRK